MKRKWVVVGEGSHFLAKKNVKQQTKGVPQNSPVDPEEEFFVLCAP